LPSLLHPETSESSASEIPPAAQSPSLPVPEIPKVPPSPISPPAPETEDDSTPTPILDSPARVPIPLPTESQAGSDLVGSAPPPGPEAGTQPPHPALLAAVTARRPKLVYAVAQREPGALSYRVLFEDGGTAWVLYPVIARVAPLLMIDFMQTRLERWFLHKLLVLT
jgi:hypothetical protein